MSFIKRIKTELAGKSFDALWAYRISTHFDESTPSLIHPFRLSPEILKKQVPEKVDLNHLLKVAGQKQKELARRFNIPNLPSDRQPGYLGQAALFESLRLSGYDLSFYIDDLSTKQKKMWVDGFGLLHTLGMLCYCRRYFNYEEIDLVHPMLEPITQTSIGVVWDKNWMQRVVSNLLNLRPNIPCDTDSIQILKHLVRIQDNWGLTVDRVMEWTGRKHGAAKRLIHIMSACGLVHLYNYVSKNTGIVRTFTKNRFPSKDIVSEELLCTSLNDGQRYYIVTKDEFKDSTTGQYCEIDATAFNIDNYDLQNREWRFGEEANAKDADDVKKLLHNSDFTIPDNSISPTPRDLLFLALFHSIPIEHNPRQNNKVMNHLVQYHDIPKKDVELGMRSLFRKKMVSNYYSAPLSHDRLIMFILFEDSIKRTASFLGRIIPIVPKISLRSNFDLTYGCLYLRYLQSFSQKVHDIVESAILESGVNAETFLVESFNRTDTASLLELIPDDFTE
ncbi:MAG: hypothetical protein ACTSSE_10165 [Candidatus Thorarchaeota archaeon]